MVAVPAATPATMPVVEPMVATPGADEDQVPPVVASVQVVDAPAQILVTPPAIAAGVVLVTATVADE